MEQQNRFKAGLRKLDTLYSDYLYDLRSKLIKFEEISLSVFVTEVVENGHPTMVFIMHNGISLRNDIKREIVRLYEEIYAADEPDTF